MELGKTNMTDTSRTGDGAVSGKPGGGAGSVRLPLTAVPNSTAGSKKAVPLTCRKTAWN